MLSACLAYNPFNGLQRNLKGKKLTIDEKSYIATWVNKHNVGSRTIGKYFNISKSVVNKYAACARDQIVSYDNSGPPTKLDEISTSSLVDKLSGNKRVQLDESQFKAQFKKEQVLTAIRRHQSPSQIKSANRKTIFNLKTKFKTKFRRYYS